MYIHGLLTIEGRAQAEQLYSAISWRVKALLNPSAKANREVVDDLNEKLADKYFGNLSIFQSMPDVWAIDQIFPIVPLHRLAEPPTRRAVLEDITCDSDGRVDYYVDEAGIDSTLPLHERRAGEPYLVGIFLVGAYQEILGDIHNLFGDTDSVHVEVDAGGAYRLLEPRKGDTVEAVLRYVGFAPDELLRSYRAKMAASAVPEGQRSAWLAELHAGMSGYTYLEP
jgi:arginine decarboxylase